MDNAPSWDQIRYFLAVVRAGSAAAAAQQLGVSHATVMRNIAQLEADLGIRLFDHVRSGYRITADGENVLLSAQAMEEHAAALTRKALGQNPVPTGQLKLSIADASLFDVMSLLRDLRRSHPSLDLSIEVRQNDAAARLSQLHLDAAFLVTNTPPEHLVGRQIAHVRLRWMACHDYYTHISSKSPDDYEWIVWTQSLSSELDDTWQRAQLKRLTSKPRVALQTERHSEALAAVRAGIGAALIHEAYSPELYTLPFAHPKDSIGVWLLTHPDLRHAGRVRALFDLVANQ